MPSCPIKIVPTYLSYDFLTSPENRKVTFEPTGINFCAKFVASVANLCSKPW
ncbi:Uncharacterised protein, partial [Mesomycoplasma hyorhinis]